MPYGKSTIRITSSTHDHLQPRINRFAFQGKNTEDTLVDPTEWFPIDESLQPFNPQREFTQRKRTFCVQSASPQPFEVLWRSVFWAVDDSKVLASAAFNGRLNQTPTIAPDETQRLRYCAFAAR